MKKAILPLALLLFTFAFCRAGNSLAGKAKGVPGFIENKGQFVTDEGNPAPEILAKASVPGLEMYLTQTGVTYVLQQYEEDNTAKPHPVYTNEVKHKIHYSRVDVDLVGASIQPGQMQFAEPVGGKINYYSEGRTLENVSQYSVLTIKNVYPNIDWVWKMDAGGKLEYDFIVHPGGDPSVIKMKYSHADIKPEENNLDISAKNGALKEGPLQASADAAKVQIIYVFDKLTNQISFKAGDYDNTKDLKIDPPLALQWDYTYGGNFSDGLRGVATDASGFVYVTGYSSSTNFPTKNAGGTSYFDGTYNGSSDAVIMKIDSGQHLLWSTYMGGSGNDFGNSIHLDNTGKVYVTGSAQTGFPVTTLAGGYNQANAGGQDAFIARFKSDLTLEWSTFYGGTGNEEGLKIITDAAHDLYVSGYTSSTAGSFPTLTNGGYYNQTSVTGDEAFILKFYSNGQRAWASTYGGSGNEYATSMAVDSINNVVITGYTTSPNFPFINPGGPAYIQTTNRGGADGFIIRISYYGVRLNSTYYGGNGDDYFTDVSIGADGSYIFTGNTASTNFPLKAAGGFSFNQTTLAGSTDAFIVKLNNDLSSFWSTYYGGSNADGGTGITTDKNGKIYLTGFTFSDNFPLHIPAYAGSYYQATRAGNSDGFVGGFSPHGLSFWSTYKGDSCYEYPQDIAYSDVYNKFYICGLGLLSCTPELIDTGSQNNNNNNGTDAFVWAFNGQDIPCFLMSVDNVTPPCPSTCNGKADALITGTTAPVSLIWSNGETAANATLLCTGESWIQAKDTNGCAAENTVVMPESLTFLSAAPENIVCGYSGMAIVQAEGGTLPYTYLWSDGSVSSESNITYTSKNYSVTVTDQAGCTVSGTAYVDLNNYSPGYYIQEDQIPYCDFGGGVLTAMLNNTPVSVQWSIYNYNTNQNSTYTGTSITDATAGYQYKINNINNCLNGQSEAISISYAPSYSLDIFEIIQTVSSSCSNPNNGGLQVICYCYGYSTFNDPISYDWSNGYTNYNPAYLAAGPYAVTLTDRIGCTTVLTYVIDPLDSATFDLNTSGGCTGNNDLSILLVDVNGGNGPPYSFNWSNSTGTVTGNSLPATNLQSGTYYVTVTDGGGCPSSQSIAVQGGNGVLNAHLVENDIGCTPSNSPGSVTANVDLGTSPYSYHWSDGSNNSSVTNIQTDGGYTVTITDANLCSTVLSDTVRWVGNYTIGAVNSFENCASSQCNLEAFYNGQPVSVVWDITQLPYSGTIPFQDTGSIITAHSGYRYTIDGEENCAIDPSGDQSNVVFDYISLFDMPTFADLTPVDATNCVPGDGQLNMNFFSSYLYNYFLDGIYPFNGSNNLTPGWYHIFAVQNNNAGCYGDLYYQINGPPPLTFNLDNTTEVAQCTGNGSLGIALPSGTNGGGAPYTFMWSNSDNSASGSPLPATNLSPGIYYVTAAGANGCADTQSVNLSYQGDLNITSTNTNCTGASGSASVQVTSNFGSSPYAYTYLWSNNATGSTVSNLAAGSYTVTVTGAAGASRSGCVTIQSTNGVLNAQLHSNDIGCIPGNSPGSVNAFPAGTPPYTYLWSDNSTNSYIDNIQTDGNYTVTITDGNHCTIALSDTIRWVNNYSIVATDPSANCYSQQCTLQALYNGQPVWVVWDITPIIPGGVYGQGDDGSTITAYSGYRYTIEGEQNCTGNTYGDQENFTFDYMSIADIASNPGLIAIDATTCNPGNGQLRGTDDYPFVYNYYYYPQGYPIGGAFTLAPGIYPIIVEQDNIAGCSTIVDYTINGPPPVVYNLDNTTQTVPCTGDSSLGIALPVATNGGGAPYTFQWSNSDNSLSGSSLPASNLSPGTYYVMAAGANGCIDTQSVSLNYQGDLNITSTNTGCGGSNGSASAQISSNFGSSPYSYTYLWSNNTTGSTVSNLAAGSYTVTVTGLAGASRSGCVTITGSSGGIIPTIVTSPFACSIGNEPYATVSGGTSPYSYNWSNGEHTAQLTSPVNGALSLTVTDHNNCTGNAQQQNVFAAPAFNASYTADTILCNGGQATIIATATGGFTPYTNTGTQHFSAGSHTLLVSDSSGCNASFTINLSEPPLLVAHDTTSAVLCHSQQATITVSASGGTPPYRGTGRFTEPAGNYTYTVTDTNGCTSNTNVSIVAPPPVTAGYTASTILCYGQQCTVTISANGGMPPYTGTGSFVLSAGTYSYAVKDSNGCGAAVPIQISQPTQLEATITATTDTLNCHGDTVHVNVAASGGTSPYTGTGELAYTQAGAYSIRVTDNNGCSIDSSLNIAARDCDTVGASINNLNNVADIRIYPNPAANSFFIEIQTPVTANGQLKLFNAQGQLVWQRYVKEGETLITADCSTLAAGVYLLRINYGSVNYYHKIVVER